MVVSRDGLALDQSRASGIRKVVGVIGMPELEGKYVFVKPNFNTADPAPGSTHIDTLRTLIELVKAQKPRKIVVGDRSGPAKTSKVFQEKEVFALSSELGFDCLVLDEMPKDRWVK